MRSRWGEFAVVAAAVLGGVLFAPVFGLGALAAPLLVVALGTLLVCELARRRPGLVAWRAVLIALMGLLGISETVLWDTTSAGLPTGATLRALGDVTDSWQRTLQSTWPARPEAELLSFVPVAVLIGCLFGVELWHRTRPPLVALLPGLAVAGLSQLYAAVAVPAGVLFALGYAVLAAVLLSVADGNRTRPTATVLVLSLAGVVGASLAGGFDPAGQPSYTLKRETAPEPTARLASPLADIARRLGDPGEEVFRYKSAGPVDRWRLVVLDQFDGVTWRNSTGYRRLGTSLRPSAAVTAPTDEHSASVSIGDLEGPWLPSQLWPTSVTGIAPLVDETGGALRSPPDTAASSYELDWRTPRVGTEQLLTAKVDDTAPGGLSELGDVPAEIVDRAEQASGGQSPSFRTAMRIEQYLRDKQYTPATDQLPTGHSWHQLSEFLARRQPGTSEQFAAAYVVLARLNAIPARLVVGFRPSDEVDADGNHVVRNRQVLAWPEIALKGVGWWPLDPYKDAKARAVAGSPEDLTDQVRKQLPPSPPPPTAEPPDEDDNDDPSTRTDIGDRILRGAVITAASLAAATVLVLLAIPVTRFVRTRIRRRRTGQDGVLAAWTDARDRLRAHGLTASAAMTVRDLAPPAERIGGRSAAAGLHRLAGVVDRAVWSGETITPPVVAEAWAAVLNVRSGLRDRPLTARLRAVFHLRSLRRPR